MTVQLRTVLTKTISAPTAEGLDGNITTVLATMNQEKLVAIRFAAVPGLFIAFIVFTK